MTHRPFAVQLIAAYLWLKATVLIACVVVVHFRPSTRPIANGVIEGLVPMIMAWGEPAHDIWLAPLFILVDATLGSGVWFLQKWARTIVVVDLIWLYGRALLGMPVVLAFHRDKPHIQSLPVSFEINLAAGIVILAALCDPDVKRAFGVRLWDAGGVPGPGDDG